MSRRLLLAASAAAFVLGVTACGSNSSEPQVAFTVPPKNNCTPAQVTKPPVDQKPTVDKQTGPAPTTLQVKDIKTGDGPEAKAGDKVTVEYVGVLYKDGTEFDSSWSRSAEPFPFTLGQGQVIPGWDQGVAGMKPGGRRELIIPADLAYGAQGSPPKIGPNETLVFVVDLLQVCPPVVPVGTSTTPSAPGGSTPASTPAGSTPASTPASTPVTTAAGAPTSSATATSAPASSTTAK